MPAPDLAQEDFDAVLYDLLVESFRHVEDEAMRHEHAAFIVEALHAGDAHLVKERNLGLCLQIAEDVNAPHGNTQRKTLIVLHWAPKDPPVREPPVREPPTHKPPVRKPPLRIDDTGIVSVDSDDGGCDPTASLPTIPSSSSERDLKRKRKTKTATLRETHPQRPFDTMLDRGSFSIDKVLKNLPQLENEALMLDIYTRRRSIRNMAGDRLTGTQPYDFNESVSVHHAYAVSIIEASEADIILLCGRSVLSFFEENFGTIERGMLIGDKKRHVFYVDHPEFWAVYSPRSRLECTLSTFRRFAKVSGMTFDDAWLCDQIKTRGQPKQPPPAVPRRIPKQQVDAAKKLLARQRLRPRKTDLPVGEGRYQWTSEWKRQFHASSYGAKWSERHREWFNTPAGMTLRQKLRSLKTGVPLSESHVESMLDFWQTPNGIRLREEKSTRMKTHDQTPEGQSERRAQGDLLAVKSVKKWYEEEIDYSEERESMNKHLHILGFPGLRFEGRRAFGDWPGDAGVMSRFYEMIESPFPDNAEIERLMARHNKSKKRTLELFSRLRKAYVVAERVVGYWIEAGKMAKYPEVQVKWHCRRWME